MLHGLFQPLLVFFRHGLDVGAFGSVTIFESELEEALPI